jgi:rubrerythrin
MTAGLDFRSIAEVAQVEPLEWVCRTCGYGVAVPHEPPPCPMCRGTEWEPRPRRLRHSAVADLDPLEI